MAFEKITSLLSWKSNAQRGAPEKEREVVAPEVRAQAQVLELAFAAFREHERKQKWKPSSKLLGFLAVILLVSAFLWSADDIAMDDTKFAISKTTFRTFSATALAGYGGSILAADATPIAAVGSTTGKGNIVFIPVRGGISGSLYNPADPSNTVLYLYEALQLAKKEGKNLAGVIIYIDSPGGDAVASAHGYRLIKEFREETKVPVIAFVASAAYSGGYYFALGADMIIADPEAGVGSIGVIFSMFNQHAFGRLLGLRENNIVSGVHKDAGSKWKEINEFDQIMMQRSVDQTFHNFLVALSESRGIPLDVLKKETQELMGRSSGAWFSAEDALSKKLIDRQLSGEAMLRAFASDLIKRQGYSEVDVLRFERRISLSEKLARHSESVGEHLVRGVTREALRSRVELRAE